MIGINTFKRTASEGLNFAVSIVDVLQQLDVKKPNLKSSWTREINECGNLKPKGISIYIFIMAALVTIVGIGFLAIKKRN